MGFAQPTTSRAGESATYGSAERFLSLLADSSRPPVPAHDIAVIVAHPDDETVGCGAQLPRLDDATVIVLTDAAAFAVHAAAELKRRGGERLSIVEMPFYRADGDNKWALQSFPAHCGPTAITIRLTESERTLKRAMLAAHRTQRRTLSPFSSDFECFRCAPPYDFRTLPNAGQLLYERYDWGMTGEDWLRLTQTATRKLGLGDGPWA